MAQYGGKIVSSNGANTEILTVENNSTVTAGDFVSLQNDSAQNAIELAVAGLPIYGIALETVVGDGTKKCMVLKLRPESIIAIDNDNVGGDFGTANKGAGNYFSLIGTTGQQLVDTSTGSAADAGAMEGTPNTFAQLLCVKQDPYSDKPSIGWFKVNPAMLQA